MLTTINAIVAIAITAFVLSAVLERKKRRTLALLLRSVGNVISMAKKSEQELQITFNETLHYMDSVSMCYGIRTGSLIQIAETVVYTKTRIKTYYDAEHGETFEMRDPPTFLASGIEIDPRDLQNLLRSKTGNLALEESKKTTIPEYGKVIPFKRQSS